MADNGKWRKLPEKTINAVTNWLIGTVGLNLQGANVLTVRGRTSSVPRSVTVNLLDLDGRTYLLSPRGQTQWVKNLRQARQGSLRRGREVREFRVIQELPDQAKIPVIRAYLDRWHWQVGKLMHVSKDADDSTIARIAANHPIFEITLRPARTVVDEAAQPRN